MPGRDDWNYDTIVLDVYNDGYNIDYGVGRDVYSGKLDLNISLRLPNYCRMLVILRAAQ